MRDDRPGGAARPITSDEMIRIRKQRKSGWSLERVADYWSRSMREADVILWYLVGRPWGQNTTQTRDFINRKLALLSVAQPAGEPV